MSQKKKVFPKFHKKRTNFVDLCFLENPKFATSHKSFWSACLFQGIGVPPNCQPKQWDTSVHSEATKNELHNCGWLGKKRLCEYGWSWSNWSECDTYCYSNP